MAEAKQQPTPTLVGRIQRVTSLSDPDREQLFALFARYYDDVSAERFAADLAEKSHIIVLRDRQDSRIQGFSTLKVWWHEVAGRRVKIVFTGDTVVDKAYWGSRELQRQFTTFLGRAKLASPWATVYWFLMTKGYRTYLTMAKNFAEFYPCHSQPTPPFEGALIQSLAEAKCPGEFEPQTGLIRYKSTGGHVREGVADITADLLDDPHIRFFYERNPTYTEGTELVCVGKLKLWVLVHSFSKVVRRALGLQRSPSRSPASLDVKAGG